MEKLVGIINNKAATMGEMLEEPGENQEAMTYPLSDLINLAACVQQGTWRGGAGYLLVSNPFFCPSSFS